MAFGDEYSTGQDRFNGMSNYGSGTQYGQYGQPNAPTQRFGSGQDQFRSTGTSMNRSYTPQSFSSYTPQQKGPVGQQGQFVGAGPNPWENTLNTVLNREFGNWNDPKQAAGAQAYMTSYGVPMLQLLQNDRTQQFNERSWLANYGEQQYLNQNQVGLDWAASGREDAGLNYAMMSGDRQFGEGQRQFDVTSGQNKYALETQRAEQEALAQYQSGQISIGQMEAKIAAARQQADAAYQMGSLKSENVKIANEYQIAQKQNEIDQMYKAGLISVEQKNAATDQLRAQNEFALGKEANAIEKLLGQGALKNESTQIANQYQIAQQQNKIDQMYKAGLISVEQKNAATNQLKVQNEFKIAQQQNEIDQAYKQGLISVEQKNAATAQLRAQNEFLLGKEANATALLQAQNEFTLGKGQLANQQFANQTGRLEVQNQYQIAQQQNQIDQMYKQGLISVEQKNAATARLQQESEQARWQAGQQFQYTELAEQLALERERMRADAMNQRYAVFGRAQAPNMAAWAQSWR